MMALRAGAASATAVERIAELAECATAITAANGDRHYRGRAAHIVNAQSNDVGVEQLAGGCKARQMHTAHIFSTHSCKTNRDICSLV